MHDEKLAKTPLHRCHLQLGARMVPFAGYDMPVQYTGVLEETRNVRKACGLFDVSHMGQFSLRGKNTLQELQKLITNDLSKLGLGQAQYNMLCNNTGGTIDDLVVYRRADDHTYICVNASNRAKDFEWMKSYLGKGITFEDESDETALIALQGPQAEAILCLGADPQVVKGLKYYWASESKVFDQAVYLSRTGYTGEDGYELYVHKDGAIALWEKLLEVGRKFALTACGLGARDTLRLEMGYPLHGHELSPTISPLAVGLSWVVKLNQPTEFIGKGALKREALEGSAKVLKAFVIEDRRIARQGYRIADTNRTEVGEITSGTLSPHLNTPIALGFVKKEFAKQDRFLIQIREDYVPAKLVKLPFVQPKTKKL